MDATGITSSTTTTLQDPVDIILSLFTSDVGSIALGVLGILALLIGRMFFFFDNSEETAVVTTTSVTRSNLLAICAAGAILLNGVSKLNVESALATPVDLIGVVSVEPAAILLKHRDLLFKNDMTEGTSSSRVIQWTMKSFLVATSALTVVLLGRNKDAWCILALAGRIPRTLYTPETDDHNRTNDNGEVFNRISIDDLPFHTPILDRFLTERRRETYLPTLQALPGKIEFTYLASNTQAALLVPVQRRDDNDDDYKFRPMVLVLGSNQARSFTPRDIAWCQAVSARLGDELSKAR